MRLTLSSSSLVPAAWCRCPQDHVVERRTAGALGVLPDVADSVHAVGQRRSPCGSCRRRRLGGEFIGAPVEAQAADELGEAAMAQHDVVAAEALHDVAAGDAADHDVIAAVERLLAGRRAGVAEHQSPWPPRLSSQSSPSLPVSASVPSLPMMMSLPRPPMIDVVTAAAFDLVVAVAAKDGVDAVAAIDGVVAFVAMQGVVALAAITVSLPLPPNRKSLPTPPSRTSLPPSPQTVSSSAAPAVSLSLPSVPPRTMVLPRKLSSPMNCSVPSAVDVDQQLAGRRVVQPVDVSNVPSALFVI